MDVTIRVYVTTKTDSLPDLASYQTEEEFYKWKSDVEEVSFESGEFKEFSDALFMGRERHEVVEGHALIEYPPGEVLEARSRIARPLADLFKARHIKFTSAQTRDEQASPGVYQASLELIVKSPSTPPS